MNHLRQIDPETVSDLCDRAEAITSPSAVHIRMEIDGFRQSATPWDATRLANILDNYRYRNTPEVKALVADLDAAAEVCAGVAPSNRHSRRL